MNWKILQRQTRQIGGEPVVSWTVIDDCEAPNKRHAIDIAQQRFPFGGVTVQSRVSYDISVKERTLDNDPT